MPHQCVRCNKLYDDGAKEILSGCSCGGRFFFYVRKEKLEEVKEVTKELDKMSLPDREQMEEDVKDIIGAKDEDKPIILDLETIRVISSGKYHLDLVDMFKGKPLVFKLEDGKYFIDLAQSFQAKDLDVEKVFKKK